MQRSARANPRGAREALLARVLVRTALSQHASGIAPSRWRFTTGPHGRPEILGPSAAPRLSFNLSHTRGLMVCAVTAAGTVGVDLEWTGRKVSPLRLARRFFTAEELAQVQACPERFLQLWTLKEACLKALGSGLSLSPRTISFQLDRPRLAAQLAPELARHRGSFRLALLRCGPQHVAAVALRDAASPVRVQLGRLLPLAGQGAFDCSLLACSAPHRRPPS